MSDEERFIRRIKIFIILFLIGLMFLMISKIIGLGQLFGWW